MTQNNVNEMVNSQLRTAVLKMKEYENCKSEVSMFMKLPICSYLKDCKDNTHKFRRIGTTISYRDKKYQAETIRCDAKSNMIIVQMAPSLIMTKSESTLVNFDFLPIESQAGILSYLWEDITGESLYQLSKEIK